MSEAMKLPEMKVGVDKIGQTLYTITPDEFQAAIEKDGEMYKGDFQRLGIQPE